jgi:translocation and assembly module TamB
MAARGSVKVSAMRFSSPASPLAARDIVLDVDGQRGADEVVTGKLGLRFARVELGGGSPVVASDGHVELRVGGLHPDPKDPLATRGDVAVSMDAGSIDARASGKHVTVDGLALRAHTVLDGHAPYNLELEAPVSRLRVVGTDGKMLTDGPSRLEIKARDVQPDLDHPVATRGVFEATVDLGKTRASVDATKASNGVDYKLRVTAPTLRVIRPFLPPALLERAAWDRMAFEVQSSGHVEPLGGPALAVRHTTEVKLDHFSFGAVAAQAVVLKMQSHGTALQHEADIDLRIPGLTIDGGPASNDHATLLATVDRERPSLRFKLATDGRVATQLAGSLSFDPSRKALVYEADAHLAGLGPLAAFASTVHGLDAFDLSQLELTFSARGALLGVVAGIARDGTLALEPSPTRTAAVEGDADLKLAHLRWAHGDTVVTTPALAWHGTMHAGPRRTLDSRLELAALHVAHGSHTIDVNGIKDEATASASGDLASPELELTQQLSVSAVAQDLFPGYPLGDLALALSLEQSREGVVHITQAKVANGLGGTTLALSGTVDTLEGHRYLALTTSLTQDLARLSTVPAHFTGRGKVSVEAKVTSPDLAFYTVRAAVKGQDVSLTLPAQGVEMDAANGEVPVTVTVDVSNPKGVWLERGGKPHQYSMLRFADQHPLLTNSGFLSIARLKTPFVTVAPLVGSLEIDQNVVSLRQFELGVRGGTITGQCAFDWQGRRSTLELHVRASGVQSSHGEPFDGNISVIVSAADRTVEGRAEILRIGERHLLDLLDLQDPQHVDPGMNRIRTALNFGYPDKLRLVFDHGFASAHLELGGLARLVSIGELRGIPMGPIVDKMIAPLLEESDTKEAP